MDTIVLVALSILLWLVYTSNTRARYYLKFTLFIILSLIAGTVFIPLMFFKPRDSRNALLPAWLLRWTSRILGISYEVRGHENIVQNSGCVVLMNHQSSLDLIVLANIWPVMDHGCVIAKKEVFYLWPFGLASWLWGTVFIDRLHPDKAQNTINKTGEYINSKKARLCMFPEGTRHEGDSLLPFKKGAFHVALAAQCPIQPVAISKYHFLNSKTHRFDSCCNIIEVLPAIPTKGLTKEQLPDLMDQVRNVMMVAVARVSKETVPKLKSS